MTSPLRLPLLAAALALLAALAPAGAQVLPGPNPTLVLEIPELPLGGSGFDVLYNGPQAGNEILGTTFELTFVTDGSFSAADIQLSLLAQVLPADKEIVLTGADLGWTDGAGSFEASFTSDGINGEAFAFPGFPNSQISLFISAVDGGQIGGIFMDSRIVLELALEEQVCQEDLGFGGPGKLLLSVCGEGLAPEQVSTLTLEGAPGGAPVFFVLGTQITPTPFKGGLLVPVPVLALVGTSAPVKGPLALEVRGGGGPLEVIVQAVVPDAGQPAGFALSNAVLAAFAGDGKGKGGR